MRRKTRLRRSRTLSIVDQHCVLQSQRKASETPLITRQICGREQGGRFSVTPLAQLKPGLYTCQVDVIDDAGGNFSFPPFPALVRKPAAAPSNGGQRRRQGRRVNPDLFLRYKHRGMLARTFPHCSRSSFSAHLLRQCLSNNVTSPE